MATCRSILVVEDDASIRFSLSEILQTLGYPVCTAENGEEALKALHHMDQPCLILLDWMMPVMDGEQFLKFKQHDVAIAPIPVVVVSAIADRTKVAGVSGFIKKPIDFDLLLKWVKQYCGESECPI